MKKYIIREYIDKGGSDARYFFDDDYMKGNGGEKDAIIYCLFNDGYGNYWGFNGDEYKVVVRTANNLQYDIEAVLEYGERGTCKSVMELYGINYNSKKCHDIKEWARSADTDSIEDIAIYLSITTGKKWACERVNGYNDYIDILYCEQYHTSMYAQKCGEVCLGLYRSFSVMTLNDDGKCIDEVSGFVVADCEAWADEDIKALICEWEGIPMEDTELQYITGSHTHTVYEYEAI